MVNIRSYVRISEDNSEAWLYLCAPEDAEFYEKSEIMHYLNVNKVVAGINESHVMAMCKKKIYEREVKVASKVMGEAGQPGYYEFKFSTEKPKPEIRKDGSVDYRAMSLIQNVEEGDLLASYHPAVQGTSSRDVTGAFDKSDLYKDLRPLTGKGIAQSDTNPNEYYATKSGKIEYDGENKLSIVEVYEINGGCDLADNAVVEFNGDVIIHGNVEAGVMIRVGKSLTVEGVVESANLRAGGDICLKRGMQGAGKGKIISGGDVFTEFIEYASVQAAGSVQANVILNSRVSAGNLVTLTGKKGLIAGGSVHAMMGISCITVGNQSEIKTGLHVGVMPEMIEQRAAVNSEYAKLNEELEAVVEGMAKILRVRQKTGELSEQLQLHLNELKERKDDIYSKCIEVKKRAEDYEMLMMQSREAKIRVEGSIYKGVIISVDNHQMAINKDTSFMEYRAQSGMIVGTVVVV